MIRSFLAALADTILRRPDPHCMIAKCDNCPRIRVVKRTRHGWKRLCAHCHQQKTREKKHNE